MEGDSCSLPPLSYNIYILFPVSPLILSSCTLAAVLNGTRPSPCRVSLPSLLDVCVFPSLRRQDRKERNRWRTHVTLCRQILSAALTLIPEQTIICIYRSHVFPCTQYVQYICDIKSWRNEKSCFMTHPRVISNSQINESRLFFPGTNIVLSVF